MRILTQDEAIKLGLTPFEKFALINTKKNTVFLGSNVPGSCEEVFDKMKDGNHPLVPDLELIEQAAA